MVDWSKLPDVLAVALLACAFASVLRRSQMPVSLPWLTGWLMIVLHFAVFLFVPIPGFWGTLALVIGVSSLTWAGILFMWATVPYRQETSSHWIVASLLVGHTLYIALLITGPAWAWTQNLAAIFIGAAPLAITLLRLRRFNHPFRWLAIVPYSVLSVFLLIFQHRPGNGPDLALNAVLFNIYFGCCTHFIYRYRRATAGTFITIAGFFAWSAVFVAAPLMAAFLPQVAVESEMWNLPKYVVAVGMILLMLEEQIEHNRHLALHDDLTGLPNRRLFQDRLASALERARRTEAHAALLVIDLDRFKQVNDSLGHHVGDLLLQRVSSILAGRIRRSDTVARTGGDEFSVILEEPISRADAERVSRSLLRLLKEPLRLGDHTVRIGASVGIAVFPEDASDMETLCIAADLRMYDAKHDARGMGKQPPLVTLKSFSGVDSEKQAGA
ncbi:MAG: GGDEF domain-containing protein [Terracidiphilus sp.]